MRIWLRVIILVLAALAGLGTGMLVRVGLGHRLANHQPGTLLMSGATKSNPVTSKRRSAASTIDDSPLATQLARELGSATGVTSWFYWLDALQRANPADFPRLVSLAQGKPAAMRFLAVRWADVAPRDFFDFLVAAVGQGRSVSLRDLAYTLFSQWPKKDLDGAIAALNEPGALGLRDGWRHQVADGVLAVDVERGLRLMAEWHIENYGPRMNTITKWAAADPQHAADFTMQNAAGYVSQLTMETIGKEWAKTTPEAALDYAAKHPGALGSALGSAALKQWSGKTLDDAAAWLGSTDARTRGQLSPAFVETWAKKDASSALDWCQENLQGSTLAQAVAGVVKGAAERDVVAAASLVTEMPPSSARSAAAVEVARKWFPGLSTSERVKPDAIAWMSGLDDDARRQALHTVVWDWATSDPTSMATFLSSLRLDQMPSYADSILARQMARKNGPEAIAWTSQLAGERGMEAGAEAFAEWRSFQPDAAMKWFKELPSNDPRRDPFFENAIRTLAYHPQAADQLAAMSAPDRDAARKVLQSMTSLPEERRSRLLQVLASQ